MSHGSASCTLAHEIYCRIEFQEYGLYFCEFVKENEDEKRLILYRGKKHL